MHLRVYSEPVHQLHFAKLHQPVIQVRSSQERLPMIIAQVPMEVVLIHRPLAPTAHNSSDFATAFEHILLLKNLHFVMSI
jgi:hypothetical protein